MWYYINYIIRCVLWPSKVPQKRNPEFFYADLMKQYSDDGYDVEESNKGVQYSYLGHIKSMSD